MMTQLHTPSPRTPDQDVLVVSMADCHTLNVPWFSLTQLYAIRDRAQLLVASGLSDKIVADKQRERNDAWFEKASAFVFV